MFVVVFFLVVCLFVCFVCLGHYGFKIFRRCLFINIARIWAFLKLVLLRTRFPDMKEKTCSPFFELSNAEVSVRGRFFVVLLPELERFDG